jgi:hypothetical protein
MLFFDGPASRLDQLHTMEDRSIPPRCDLPSELLSHIFTHLQCPTNCVTGLQSCADCVGARTVCCSWHSTMCDHCPPHKRQPPWVVLPYCCFLTYPKNRLQYRPILVPEGAILVPDGETLSPIRTTLLPNGTIPVPKRATSVPDGPILVHDNASTQLWSMTT